MDKKLPDLYQGYSSFFVPQAYSQVLRLFSKGAGLISSEEPDMIQVKVVADEIENRCLPIITDLGKMREVPMEWITSLDESVRQLLADLRTYIEQMGDKGLEK